MGEVYIRLTTMKFLVSVMLSCVSLSSAANWIDLCDPYSQYHCCVNDGTAGMKNHSYWFIRNKNQLQSWHDLDQDCRSEEPASNSRMVVFESKRELDCVTKYIIDKYDDATAAEEFAIGLHTDSEYDGIYEWNRVDTSTDVEAATLKFSNWKPNMPTGLGCVSMTVGPPGTDNGRWSDVDCLSGTMYG